MKNLYVVTGYHFGLNSWLRFAVSAEDADSAAQEVKRDYDKLLRVSSRFICSTEDDVYTEL